MPRHSEIHSYYYSKTQLWHDQYLNQYYDLLSSNNDIITAHLFGHLHSDEFRVINPDLPPMLLCSSITPVTGTNPSFKVITFQMEGNGSILDYDIYNTNLEDESWNELYSFSDTYQVPDISASSLKQVVEKLSNYKDNGKYFNTFLQFLDANYIAPSEDDYCDNLCHTQWICNLQSASTTDYQDCLRDLSSHLSFMDSSSPIMIISIIIIIIAIILIIIICVVRK